MDEMTMGMELQQRPTLTDEDAKKMLEILEKYHAAKQDLDQRVRSAENWWRLRNSDEAVRSGIQPKPGYKSRSGWLHNIIQNKHADAMDAYPEPNVLPREPGDRQEAEILSKILPCILEQNRFEQTYSRAWFSKLKFGTGVYKVIWDPQKLNGLGDISLLRCNILTLFWEPSCEDIQDSRYFFEVNYLSEEDLRMQFPQLGDVQLPHDRVAWLFPEEEKDRMMNEKVPLISAYYHKNNLLHLAQFIPGTLLYATENDEQLAATGIYDHGMYPYVFDALFPVEKSPAGYGYVDLCKQPQIEIDLMKTAFVENTKSGAKPRYFSRNGGGVNKQQFLNLDETIIEVDGSLDDAAIRPVDHVSLDGNHIAFLQETIQEMRETAGNSDAAAGTTPSGVTAASAIAALQEASGKTSRDTAMTGYSAFRDIIELCIELIRQFYDAPRQFRITGAMGEEYFTQYDNSGLQPQTLYNTDGIPDGVRKPVFDLKIVPQKRSAYTKMANNELALQLYGAGFFDPSRSDQALACLGMMDYDGRDETIKTVQRNGTMYDQLQMLMQWANALAAKYNDVEALAQLQDIAMKTGAAAPQAPQSVPAAGQVGGEPTHMVNARQTARGATVPNEGGGVE